MAGFGLAAGAGFAGGFAQAFNTARHQQQELELEKQRMQNQQQRELLARADGDRKEIWDHISDIIKATRAAGSDHNTTMNLISKFMPALERLTKSSGRDASMIAPQLAAMLAVPSSYDIERGDGGGGGQRQQMAGAGGQMGAQGPIGAQDQKRDTAFDQAPSSYTPGMEQGPSPGTAGPVPFMSGQVGGASQPAAGPDMQPMQQPDAAGSMGAQQEQQPDETAALDQKIERIGRAMSVAETPGRQKFLAIELQDLLRQKSGKNVHLFPMKDGSGVHVVDMTSGRTKDIMFPKSVSKEQEATLDPNDPGDLFLKNSNIPADKWALIKDIHSGMSRMPASGRGGSIELRSWVAGYGNALGEPYDENKYYNRRIIVTAASKADSGSLTALQKQRDVNSVFVRQAEKIGNRIDKLVQKIDKTGIPVIEKLSREGRRTYLGDPDVAAFDAAMVPWRTEVARVIMSNPNLAGQLTDSARKEVEQALPEGISYEQFKAANSIIKQEFGDRINSMDEGIRIVKERMGIEKSGPPVELKPEDLRNMSDDELQKLIDGQ